MEIPSYYSNDKTNPSKQNRYSCPHDPNTQFEQNCGELKQNDYFLHDIHTPIEQNGDPFMQKQYPHPHDPNVPLLKQNGGRVDRNVPFESGYTSNDGGLIKELIGRLGNISEDDQVSPQSCIVPNNLINSPPSLDLSSHVELPNYPPNLSHFFVGNADHGFAERAARFYSLVHRTPTPRPDRMVVENGDSREGSSLSDQNIANDLCLKALSQNGDSSKKRKLLALVNVVEKVEVENEESDAKRSKEEEEKVDKKQKVVVKTGDINNANNSSKGKNKSNNNNNNNNNKIAKVEPPKDYIHVRARRGQATDNHSLAERVRREKISERMRFLQDLVPGCNKVTGKATVLDEIINYVQSLQRQVEFLSMKLATVNPRLDINLEALLSKDLFQSGGAGIPQTVYPADPTFTLGYPSSQTLSLNLPYGNDNFSLNPLNSIGMRRNPGIQSPSMDGFVDHLTQVPSFWEDDLQSIVQNQMSIAQNQAQIVPGNSPLAEMRVER